MPLRSATFRIPIGLKPRFDVDQNPFASKYYQSLSDHRLPLLSNDQLLEKSADPFEFLAARPGVEAGKPIIVEIGCHKGTLLLQLARDYPEYNFIGLDITYKRVILTAERVQQAGLKNVAIALANASQFDDLFAEQSVSGLIVFFPDPWPKKSHHKHRLLNKSFCEAAYRCVADSGFVWVKTDSHGYFDDARFNIMMAGFKASSIRHRQGNPMLEGSYLSTFEKHFRAAGAPIAEGYWLKTCRELEMICDS